MRTHFIRKLLSAGRNGREKINELWPGCWRLKEAAIRSNREDLDGLIITRVAAVLLRLAIRAMSTLILWLNMVGNLLMPGVTSSVTTVKVLDTMPTIALKKERPLVQIISNVFWLCW